MNKCETEIRESTSKNDHLDANRRKERNGPQESELGDLEPQAEIKGGSLPGIFEATDVTLKRGSGG